MNLSKNSGSRKTDGLPMKKDGPFGIVEGGTIFGSAQFSHHKGAITYRQRACSTEDSSQLTSVCQKLETIHGIICPKKACFGSPKRQVMFQTLVPQVRHRSKDRDRIDEVLRTDLFRITRGLPEVHAVFVHSCLPCKGVNLYGCEVCLQGSLLDVTGLKNILAVGYTCVLTCHFLSKFRACDVPLTR